MMKGWLLILLTLLLPCRGRADFISTESLLQDPSPVEWSALARYNGTITRQQFNDRLNSVFDPFHGMAPFITITDKSVQVFSSDNHTLQPLVEVTFAESVDKVQGVTESYRTPEMIRNLQKIWSDKPLTWLHVAIEPADIGGDWANMEDRSTVYRGYGLINEGDLNLTVSKVLAKRLRELGAEVFVTRDTNAPVSHWTPQELLPEAAIMLTDKPYLLPQAYTQRTRGLSASSPRRVQVAAEVLLTKTAEAYARAEKVRENFQPDITIVLQHNATDRSGNGRLTPRNRNIFFVHGAYTAKELSRDLRQRLRLLTKLLANVTPVETEVACRIAEHFKEATGYLPVMYGDSNTTRMVTPDNNYVVARNIALNRIHDGPVVVTEPYFMNERVTLKRLLAGDYDGTMNIDGKAYISIYREYAEGVVSGLLDAYGLPKTGENSELAEGSDNASTSNATPVSPNGTTSNSTNDPTQPPAL